MAWRQPVRPSTSLKRASRQSSQAVNQPQARPLPGTPLHRVAVTRLSSLTATTGTVTAMIDFDEFTDAQLHFHGFWPVQDLISDLSVAQMMKVLACYRDGFAENDRIRARGKMWLFLSQKIDAVEDIIHKLACRDYGRWISDGEPETPDARDIASAGPAGSAGDRADRYVPGSGNYHGFLGVQAEDAAEDETLDPEVEQMALSDSLDFGEANHSGSVSAASFWHISGQSS